MRGFTRLPKSILIWILMIWTLSSSDNRDASYVDDLGIKLKKNNRNASAVMWLLPPSGRRRRSALGRGLPAPLNRSTQTEHKQKLIKGHAQKCHL